MSTKDEVKALWKLCFDDSDAFIDLYFDRKYKDDINMAVREDGKIVSALQMLPYSMTFCGGIIPTSYISGACTHPDYRNHGVMRRLLQQTHRRMYDDGIWLSTLIPAEEWLFGYYAKSGYAPGFSYIAETVPAGSLRPSAACEVKEEGFASGEDGDRLLSAEHYRYFDACMHKRSCCIQHLREDFLVVMADLRLSNGKLLVARLRGRIAGMAFCVMEDGVLHVKELLADDEAVQEALLAEAARLHRVSAMVCLSPSSSGACHLGMARVIHAGKLLSLFARKYPSSRLCICIEGDEAIPENNGCYTVEAGVCSRERLKGEKYRVCSIGAFTRLLLEAEHPYMSLMLN